MAEGDVLPPPPEDDGAGGVEEPARVFGHGVEESGRIVLGEGALPSAWRRLMP